MTSCGLPGADRRSGSAGRSWGEPVDHPGGAVGFPFAAEQIDDGQNRQVASGRIAVTLAQPPDDLVLSVGDRLWLRGRVVEPVGQTNPNGFDDREFLARRGIGSTLTARRAADIRPATADDDRTLAESPRFFGMTRLGETIRARILETTSTHLSANDAALLDGLLLSVRDRLPADVQDAFIAAGTLHLLTVSGLHIAFLAGALVLLRATLGLDRRVGNPLVLALLWLYILMSGDGVSAARAGLIWSIVLLAPLVQRTPDPLHALAVAALVLLTDNPLALYDAGFQLSFATLATLLLLLPPLEQAWLPWEAGQNRFSSMTRWLMAALLAGTVAAVGSWPLVALYFNRVSWVGPVATVVLAPIAVALIGGGLVAVFLSQLLPSLVTAPLWTLLHAGLHGLAVPGLRLRRPARRPLVDRRAAAALLDRLLRAAPRRGDCSPTPLGRAPIFLSAHSPGVIIAATSPFL